MGSVTRCHLCGPTMPMNPPNDGFLYRAFLSYRTADTAQARRLHKALERYRIPRSLVGTRGEHGEIPSRLGRIFRDRDEARSAERIDEVIASALAKSQHLIVLCTPNAVAEGSWVPHEIRLFRKVRPDGEIHAVIGAGTPPDCFPEPLFTISADGRREAPLAADLRAIRDGGADGEDKAIVRLVAGLLGVGFDDLWQREVRRRRNQRIARTIQVTSLIAVTSGAIALGNFYRTHALVEVDGSSVVEAAGTVTVVAAEESPANNASREILRRTVRAGSVRAWLPASDIIIRFNARYRDDGERMIASHLLLKPGLAWKDKRVRVATPPAREILDHSGMAYIPATQWVHGRDRTSRTNEHPYWIDIRPPTVQEYLPRAERLVREGLLDSDNSVVLTTQSTAAGIEQTGLTGVRQLGQDLSRIAGVIDQSTRNMVTAPGDIVIGNGRLPCPTCPAPMTRLEAGVACSARAMRLPTAFEWELAVRGVDGRVYPWGDQFDTARANVPGLPDQVGVPTGLKPVDAYKDQRSPFGLYDTVGNAGDWVTNEGGYERVYMGATYRFNGEDATSFRMLPVTDDDLLVQEVTARCVSPSSIGR